MPRRLYTCIALLLAVLICASSPASAAPEERAKQEFVSGALSFQNGKVRKALAHYRRSYRLAKRPRTLFNIAICEAKLGMRVEAFEHFEAFLEQAEERDAELISDARERLRVVAESLPEGQLTVESQPIGAEVYMDDEDRARGLTPLTTTVAPGSHQVQVVKKGAVSAERVVHIKSKATSAEAFVLELLSTITITTSPSDAVIRPVQRPRDFSKGNLTIEVIAGAQEFKITREGYEPQIVRIEVGPGALEKLHVDLVATVQGRADGRSSVRLRGNIVGAAFSVDGLVVGSVSLSPEGRAELTHTIAAGKHTLALERKGYRPWSKQIDFHESQMLDVHVNLSDMSSGPSAGAWALGGLGVASMVTGATYGLLALRDESKLVGPRAVDRANKADAFLAAGALTIGAAYLLSRSRDDDSTATVRANPSSNR